MSSVRALFLAVAALSIAACSGSEPAPAPQASPAPAPAAPAPSAAAAATPPEMRADLPPLPVTGFPPARPPEVVRAVFTFAADHPEVLSKMPCFCGCENRGHKHNDDCFVTGRDARGRVTGWEPHGLG